MTEPAWQKSSHSMGNGNCVEVGHAAAAVRVRDTKLGDSSPVLTFSASAWRRFAAAVKNWPALT